MGVQIFYPFSDFKFTDGLLGLCHQVCHQASGLLYDVSLPIRSLPESKENGRDVVVAAPLEGLAHESSAKGLRAFIPQDDLKNGFIGDEVSHTVGAQEVTIIIRRFDFVYLHIRGL